MRNTCGECGHNSPRALKRRPSGRANFPLRVLNVYCAQPFKPGVRQLVFRGSSIPSEARMIGEGVGDVLLG